MISFHLGLILRHNFRSAYVINNPKMNLNFRGFTGFNSVMASITESKKKGVREWSKATQKAFEEIKQKLC